MRRASVTTMCRRSRWLRGCGETIRRGAGSLRRETRPRASRGQPRPQGRGNIRGPSARTITSGQRARRVAGSASNSSKTANAASSPTCPSQNRASRRMGFGRSLSTTARSTGTAPSMVRQRHQRAVADLAVVRHDRVAEQRRLSAGATLRPSHALVREVDGAVRAVGLHAVEALGVAPQEHAQLAGSQVARRLLVFVEVVTVADRDVATVERATAFHPFAAIRAVAARRALGVDQRHAIFDPAVGRRVGECRRQRFGAGGAGRERGSDRCNQQGAGAHCDLVGSCSISSMISSASSPLVAVIAFNSSRFIFGSVSLR